MTLAAVFSTADVTLSCAQFCLEKPYLIYSVDSEFTANTHISQIFSASPITGSLLRNTNNPFALHLKGGGGALNTKRMNNRDYEKHPV